MIDISHDRIITLAEAATLLPRRRRGKKPHVSTLHRWATVGCRGVVLETIQVGGTRCIALSSLQKFCDRLSHPREDREAPTRSSSLVKRQLASEAAAKELRKLGV